MADTIKGIFETHCAGLNIDRRLAKEINRLQVGFVNRHDRDDHLHFFGHGLIGVYTLRYRTEDKDAWLNDLLEIEESDISEDIKKLPSLDPTWVRATDPVNLSCIWLLHKFYHSGLRDSDKQQAMVDVLLMLHYKFLSSLMSHYFPYPADKAVAEETYRVLNLKYDIKAFGSWGALLQDRAEQNISPNGVHYKTIVNMDDVGVINMVSDLQGRLREVVKSITEKFYQVRDNKGGIRSASAMVELDGGLSVRDKTSDYTTYTKYLHAVVPDRTSFIREELIGVVEDSMKTMPDKQFREALAYTSRNYGSRGDRNIEKLIDETMLHAYSYLSREKGIMAGPSDLPGLISNLRNLYMASRMSDPSLIAIKELSIKIVSKAITSRNSTVVASVRTALPIYLVLRSFTMSYFKAS